MAGPYSGFDDRQLVPTSHGYVHLWIAGEGPPIVLLHMSLSSGWMFRHVAQLFEGRRVIAPDRIGFGYSDHPEAPPTMANYAAATIEALDALGVGQFDVSGVHTGSVELVEIATAHPDRVRRIASVTLPVFSEDEVPAYKDAYVHDPDPALDGSHLDWYWRWWRDGGFAGADVRSREWEPELLHEFFLDHLRCLPNAWYAHHAVLDYPMADRIPRIGQPLLVLHPYDDVREQTERAIDLLPEGSKVVRLPHLTDILGHFTTARAEIAGHILDFLDA